MTARTMADRIFDNPKLKKLGTKAAEFGQSYDEMQLAAINKVLLEPLQGQGVVSAAGFGPIMAFACAITLSSEEPDATVTRISGRFKEAKLPEMNARQKGLMAKALREFAAEFTPDQMEQMGLVGIPALAKSDVEGNRPMPQFNGVYIVRENIPLVFNIMHKAGVSGFRRNIGNGEYTNATFEIGLTGAGARAANGVMSVYQARFATRLDGNVDTQYEWPRAIVEARDYTFGRSESDAMQLPEGHIAMDHGLPEALRQFITTRHVRALLRNGRLIIGNLDPKNGILDNVAPNPDTYWLY